MSTLFHYILAFIIGILVSTISFAQSPLDSYIRAAFQDNEGLHQQQFQLEKSLYALEEARSLFLPHVSLQGSFTEAAGGRTIDIPVGDLLNNVYSTLNQLTSTHNFPHLENQSVLLNPNNFYDIHLHTTLPLINAELWYNRRIHQQLITGQQAAVNVYKRELVKDIKTAYFQYYQAIQAIDIYSSALDLVRENIRVNESLYKNGVRNGTALTRSQAEEQRTISERVQATNNALNARAYFNFLLNHPSQDTILLDTSFFVHSDTEPGGGAGISNREELVQWHTIQTTNSLDFHLEKSYVLPKLNTFLDLGSQGMGTVDNKTGYYFWGISLDWDLFTGGQHRYRAHEAAEDTRFAQAGYAETTRSLQLQLDQSTNNYNSAVETYHSATAQLHFAEKYFTDQTKAYREGQLLYVEWLDAQNQLTEARLQRSQAVAAVQIAQAQLERNQASYPINTKS